MPLSEIDCSGEQRIRLNMSEVDRLLGGGLVKGSLVLLGGEPGIGKSTLSLQIPLMQSSLRTLYVTGDERSSQVKMRSERLGGEGWGRGETGNAPEGQFGVWPATTVVYTPGNAAEKAAAEEIARDNGWAVEARDERLSDAPGGVVVVTAVDARR